MSAGGTTGEAATDHAGVIMTEFAPERQRCVPGTAPTPSRRER
ncbi:hypothetical protein [Streptomyces hygroscopicus]|nr:hypothetical protein [Streptomyces hygroscopicus]